MLLHEGFVDTRPAENHMLEYGLIRNEVGLRNYHSFNYSVDLNSLSYSVRLFADFHSFFTI